MRLLLLAPFALLALFALAGPARAQAAAAPTSAERPRVLVLTPTSTQVDAPVLDSIASLIAVELQKNSSVEVLSASDVKKMARARGREERDGLRRLELPR